MEVEAVDERLADKENSGSAPDHPSKPCNQIKSGNVLRQTPSEENQPTEEPSKKKRKKKKKKKKKKAKTEEAVSEEKKTEEEEKAVAVDDIPVLQEKTRPSPKTEKKEAKIDSSLEVEAEDREIAEIQDLSSTSEARDEEFLDNSPSPPRSPPSDTAAEEDIISEPVQILEEDYLTVDEDAPSPLAMAGKEEGDVEDEDEAQVEEEEEMGPFVEPSGEVIRRIVKQMEFYFSDSNILKDYFLLRRIRKNKEGWLRVKLLAGFKLMKAITDDWRQIVFAIREKSSMLEIDEEGIRVRRKGGLPEWDHHVYKRTCLVYGFDRLAPRKKGNPEPSQISVAFVRDKLFGRFGERVKLVRVLKPGKEIPLDLKTCMRNHSELGQYLCAVVEFDTVETAEAARRLVDSREWSRTHRLSVKILGKRLSEPVEEEAENYMNYSWVPYPYFPPVHTLMVYPPRHYYRPQTANSYADQVAGRKRPAPDSYADRVRSCPKAEEAEAAATSTNSIAAPPPLKKREKRKPVPRTPQRLRTKSKSEAKTVEKGKENKGNPAPKPKTTEVTKEKRGKSSTRREEGTQTGLVLIRQPEGPPKEGTGISWARFRKPETEKLESTDKELEEGELPETTVEKGDVEENGEETEQQTEKKLVDDSEPSTESEEGEEKKEGRSKRGLHRRRSVRELVRQFEALSTDSSSPKDSPVIRRSGSVRLSETPLVERKEN